MRFLLWLRVKKLNKAGTAPVYLRIHDRDTGVRAEVSTDIRCRPDRWQGGELKIKGTARAVLLDNAALDTFKADARTVANDLQAAARRDPALPRVTPAAVAAALRPKPEAPLPLLLTLLREAIAVHSPRATTRTKNGYALDQFAKWPPAGKLHLPDLTTEAARQYAGWLAQQPLAVSSQRVYLGSLAGLLAVAAPDHPAVFKQAGRSLGVAAEPTHRILPAGWQAQLLSLRLPRAQELARDAFLLAYYLHGSRIGKVLELQWQHVDWQQQRVRFTTHKRPVQVDIALRPELHQLLARYRGQCPVFVLPLLQPAYLSLSEADQLRQRRSANNCVGQALSGICKKLGWPKLHPHLARHTMALTAYQKNGNDLRVPQQLLGHKNISTTAAYIAGLTTTELDQSAANTYD